jgi:hypothetical protein
MEEKTSTLHIRQTGTYQYEVTVPETGATKAAATLDSALAITLHDILKHLTVRHLILVFDDPRNDRDDQHDDAHECLHTDLERQAAREVVQRGIASRVKRSERQLVFELSRPLTREQATWLDEQAGKLFDSYHFKDELEVELGALWEEAQVNRRAAADE